jgi:hypothetical protein
MEEQQLLYVAQFNSPPPTVAATTATQNVSSMSLQQQKTSFDDLQMLTLPISFIEMLMTTDQPPEQQRIEQMNDSDLTELLSCVQVMLDLYGVI